MTELPGPHSRAGRILIGLHGRKGTGKDTVALLLSRSYGFARLSFAAPLKDMIAIGFGVRRADFEGEAKEIVIPWIGKSPRELLQSLGTEWGRARIAQDIWVRHAERRLAGQLRHRMRSVITDCRFEDEAAWIRAQGGTVWHIERAAAPRGDLNASERGIGFFSTTDRAVPNDGTLQDLADYVGGLMREYEDRAA